LTIRIIIVILLDDKHHPVGEPLERRAARDRAASVTSGRPS
jgi:hypothetical protein